MWPLRDATWGDARWRSGDGRRPWKCSRLHEIFLMVPLLPGRLLRFVSSPPRPSGRATPAPPLSANSMPPPSAPRPSPTHPSSSPSAATCSRDCSQITARPRPAGSLPTSPRCCPRVAASTPSTGSPPGTSAWPPCLLRRPRIARRGASPAVARSSPSRARPASQALAQRGPRPQLTPSSRRHLPLIGARRRGRQGGGRQVLHPAHHAQPEDRDAQQRDRDPDRGGQSPRSHGGPVWLRLGHGPARRRPRQDELLGE